MYAENCSHYEVASVGSAHNRYYHTAILSVRYSLPLCDTPSVMVLFRNVMCAELFMVVHYAVLAKEQLEQALARFRIVTFVHVPTANAR
jgi:hypothetical protein